MTLALPTAIPSVITAGDTVQWLRRGGTTPSTEGWQYHCVLVGATAVYKIDGTAQDADYLASASAADTAAWAPGSYSAQEYLESAGQRLTLAVTPVRIAPNLAAAATGVDTRSHAQKVLDAINAWLESKAPVAGSVEINGRKISYYPLADLLALQSRYQMLVAREQAADGSVRGTRILVRL